MKKHKIPVTIGIRWLRARQAEFEVHLYNYEEHGGTAVAAEALAVDEHCMIKTLVLADSQGQPLLMLMHGDRQVSTHQLARQLGVKSIHPCDSREAHRQTGYMVGGTSPFGTRHELPVYCEESILILDRLYINGGRRGLLVAMTPRELTRLLNPHPVQVAITDPHHHHD